MKKDKMEEKLPFVSYAQTMLMFVTGYVQIIMREKWLKKSLTEWLLWIKDNHPLQIDLSLERVTTAAKRLGVDIPDSCVVTVGGTNGKGSCVAGLESIYISAGYRVGSFTSPFFISLQWTSKNSRDSS